MEPKKTRSRVRKIAPPGTKQCPRCRRFRPMADFNGGYCTDCYRNYHRVWSKETRERTIRELMTETIAAYGGGCSVCGEKDPRVLVVLPRGAEGVRQLLYTLRKQGFPPDHALYCHNCAARQGET